MALIPVFHVVASDFPVDPTDTTDIPQGRLVALDADGNVQLALDSAAGTYPMGIAGDSRSQGTTSYTANSGSALSGTKGSLVIGSFGLGLRNTQNRLADNYNETLASGKMTVYHSGGEFWTNEYNSTELASASPGALLYAGTVSAVNGFWSTTGSNVVAGRLIQGPLSFPSGVPGAIQYPGDTSATDFTQLPEGGNSMTFGEFIRVKLSL